MNQKYSKIEKNSKKKIVVLTMSISAGSSYIADLKEILPPDQVEYLLYTPETFPKEGYIPKASVYLVSTNAILFTTGFAQELPLGVKMVETRVSFCSQELDRISKIPEGTKCLLVNTTEPLALECIVDIHGNGLFNVQLTPYWPGCPEFPDIHTAVTAGDADLIPSHITSVYDLGYRHLSPDTITEVLLAADMEYLVHDEMYHNYVSRFPSKKNPTEKLLIQSTQYKSITNCLMESSDYGIIGINGEEQIFCMNQNAIDLLQLQKSVYTGRNFRETLPFLVPYANPKKWHGRDAEQQIINYNGTTLTVSVRPILEGTRIRGFFVRLQRYDDAENKLHDTRQKLLNKGHTAKYTFSDIIGSSPAITETCRMARKMAASNSAILITGESGTGKELLASAIHNESSRAKYPYIAINCAAMPEHLLESELFGYEEGAFTGARKNGKVGLFEHAHRGTLFLDEIEDMSPSLQVKLLRVLQEKEIMRVGGTKIINVDVRIIAATNVNLDSMVQDGLIRKDLYYRLNTMQLELPPLRSRREDILPLVQHFCHQDRLHFRLSDAVMNRFMQHHWDGNIRELKNCMEYFQCLEKDIIQPEDLPRQFRRTSRSTPQPDSPVLYPQRQSLPTETSSERRLSDEENFVLQCLYQAFCEKRLIGRRTICDLAQEGHQMLTEQEIRKILKNLEASGLVKVGSGRAGSRLTPAGVALMQKGMI